MVYASAFHWMYRHDQLHDTTSPWWRVGNELATVIIFFGWVIVPVALVPISANFMRDEVEWDLKFIPLLMLTVDVGCWLFIWKSAAHL
jgi:hypothetical protein